MAPLPTQVRGAALAAAVLAGCGAPELALDLLQVTGVADARVTPDTPLSIAGAGFPAGRRGTLHLTGRRHRPGDDPSPVDAYLDVVAVDEALAQVSLARLDPAPGDAFVVDGRLTFTAASGHRVSGAPSRLAFTVDGDPVAGQRIALDRAVDRALGRLGLVPRETEAGLVLDAAGSGAAAWVGEATVLRADGFPVHRKRDLLAGEGRLLDPLEVQPGVASAPELVSVGRLRRAGAARWHRSAPLVLCFGWLGAVILAGRRRRARRSSAAPISTPTVLARVAQAVALVLPGALAAHAPWPVGLLELWAGLLVLRTVASPRLRWTPAHVVVAVARGFHVVAPLGLVLVAIAAVTGVRDLPGLVAWQGQQRLPALILTLPPMLFAIVPLAQTAFLRGGAVGPSVLRAFVVGTTTTVLGGGWGLAAPPVGAALATVAGIGLLIGLERHGDTLPRSAAWGWLGAGLAACGALSWAAAPASAALLVGQLVVGVLILAPSGATAMRRVGVG